ncbi:MAG: hypothetical protein BroJett030_23290 [Alphaproteobacteria bacterium]|nr:MAG: hypothetical protein BroJett030_23290 [Alphaproteobacteria bacterium]
MNGRPAQRGFLACLLLAAAIVAAGPRPAPAQATPPPESPVEGIQMGISVDTIPVGSDFAGTRIAVFGTIENPDRIGQMLNEYSIVVTVTGPLEDIVVRRKERVFGVWMNRASRVYRAVPAFYAVASSRSLASVAPEETLKAERIGVDYLSFNLYSAGAQTFILPAPEFATSLRRIRRERDLFAEHPDGVVFLGSSLFRATVPIPSNTPIGAYTVSGHLFRDGQMLASRSGSFRVERAGFEHYMFSLAHVYSYWYGLLAVAAALATGWLASIVFARN